MRNSADSIVANTVSTARNYWGKTDTLLFGTTFIRGGVLVPLRGGGIVSIEDVCARLQSRPFDPDEPLLTFNFPPDGAIADVVRPRPSTWIATLETRDVGVIATTIVCGNQSDGSFSWEPVRFPETTAMRVPYRR